MNRHLRNILGLTITAAALAGFGAIVAAEATARIAKRLWPADEPCTFVVAGWDAGAC